MNEESYLLISVCMHGVRSWWNIEFNSIAVKLNETHAVLIISQNRLYLLLIGLRIACNYARTC
jgi:hypothetical protein